MRDHSCELERALYLSFQSQAVLIMLAETLSPISKPIRKVSVDNNVFIGYNVGKDIKRYKERGTERHGCT
jgi:hypothetical protein